MQQLIDESLQIAKEQFLGYGFTEEQFEPLLQTAKRDLERELTKLLSLLSQNPLNMEALSLNLHSLKGLLLNMGNKKASDLIVDIRSGIQDGNIDIKESLQEFLDQHLNTLEPNGSKSDGADNI